MLTGSYTCDLRREEKIGADAARAGLVREVSRVAAAAGGSVAAAEVGLEASKAGLLLVPCVLVLTEKRVPHEHAEALELKISS